MRNADRPASWWVRLLVRVIRPAVVHLIDQHEWTTAPKRPTNVVNLGQGRDVARKSAPQPRPIRFRCERRDCLEPLLGERCERCTGPRAA